MTDEKLQVTLQRMFAATKLQRLFEVTNEILENLKKDLEVVASVSDDAINWGDLFCFSAEHFCNHNGREGYRVWIEGVQPGAERLPEYVRKKLEERAWWNIDVQTEWKGNAK